MFNQRSYVFIKIVLNQHLQKSLQCKSNTIIEKQYYLY